MNTEWTLARIKFAKQCYGTWARADYANPSALWLVSKDYAMENYTRNGMPVFKLTPAGRDALDREIGDTA